MGGDKIMAKGKNYLDSLDEIVDINLDEKKADSKSIAQTVANEKKYETEHKSILQKEELQDIFTRLTMTLPESINRPLEDYINTQKRKGVKKFDIIYKKDRKISKSSYMVEALINQMKRDGIIT